MANTGDVHEGPEASADRAQRDSKPGRRSRIIFWVLILGLLIFQWPTLKGCYYGMSDSAGPPQGISWRATWETAMAESRQTGKPVLAYFTASWCPPCRVMKHETWPNARVQEIVNERVIPLYLDVDDPATTAHAERYQVSGIPTLLVLNADGRPQHAAEAVSATKMVAFIQKAAPVTAR